MFGRPQEDYGSDYSSHLLDQYKLYVEMADRISQRRHLANSFFLTGNTALVALLGLSLPSTSGSMDAVWFALVGIAGVVLSLTWYRLVCSYRDLNSAKFQLIHDIEAVLPIRPFYAEWKRVGEGERPSLYLPFSHIELAVPWVFAILYLLLSITAFF